MLRQPIVRREREPGEAGASVFFTCKCYNVIINTWHGAWLNYPACLIKGALYCSSPPLCHLPLSVMFHHLLFPFLRCLFLFSPISLYIPFPYSFSLLSPHFLSPSFTSTSWPVNLPPSLSVAPSLRSLSCFHSHTLSLFPSIGFNRAKFCEEPLTGAPWGQGNDRRRPLFTSLAPTVSSA